ncbi:MAG: hypothetical protein HY543_06010 [Deltaproteobacteria bacterium]|nr:hypothetical protein [Deltaproteobacteria bacterium]
MTLDRFHRIVIGAAYFFGAFVATALVCIEREHRAVRLHALQALVLHIGFLLLFVPLACLGTACYLAEWKVAGKALITISTVLAIAAMIGWGYLLVRVGRGRLPRIPTLTDWLADKSS